MFNNGRPVRKTYIGLYTEYRSRYRQLSNTAANGSGK